jgi:hypothetical protein
MLPDAYCRSLASHPEIGRPALSALAGDVLGRLAAADWLEENCPVKIPFEVGKSYLICTVTLYYVGRVVEADLGWVTLADASWVHWTGRLSTLLARQSFTHRDLSSRKPRVEPCGEVILSLGGVIAAYPWTGGLPKEPVQ